MLSLRYHIASLSAVFIALIVGILVGVGISGRGFVDKSERRNFESRIASLQNQVAGLNAEKSLLGQQGQAAQSFVEDTYPALMANRLAHRRIAVIVIGSNAAAAGADVAQTLTDAGATTAFYRAIKEPVTLRPLLQSLHGLAGFRNLPDIAYELAQEWVTRGASPVADRVAPLVVDEQRGAAFRPVDGVVIVERAPAPDAATERFVDGLIGGLTVTGVPVVAVERTSADPARVPQWQKVAGLSTVDNIDTSPGRLALALLLEGAEPGSYGVKSSADALLPKLAPAG
jgi:Copper transport outer membrane protein, MctB